MINKKILSIFLILIFVSSSGCIIGSEEELSDRDGDGVQDKYDACPDIPGDPSNQGCPTDETPPPTSEAPTTTPAPAQDTDGDGVRDSHDACPEIPGDPSNQGCPLPETEAPAEIVDTDGDGVQDTYDACPDIAGDPSNQGCPSEEDEPDELVKPIWSFTAIPTFTLSPTIAYYQWLGEWDSDGTEWGAEKLWIVINEEGKLDVHCFVRTILFPFYIGHFTPTMQDGSFVGELEFDDHSETISLTLSEGTITAVRTMDYGNGTNEQTSHLAMTGSIVLTDSNYVESYAASWFKIGDLGRVKSLYISQTDPNRLDVHIWGNCIPTPCDWDTHSVYFSPSGSINVEFQDGNYTRRFELLLNLDGELEVYWEFEHSGGGISAGVEEFFKLIYL